MSAEAQMADGLGVALPTMDDSIIGTQHPLEARFTDHLRRIHRQPRQIRCKKPLTPVGTRRKLRQPLGLLRNRSPSSVFPSRVTPWLQSPSSDGNHFSTEFGLDLSVERSGPLPLGLRCAFDLNPLSSLLRWTQMVWHICRQDLEPLMPTAEKRSFVTLCPFIDSCDVPLAPWADGNPYYHRGNSTSCPRMQSESSRKIRSQ